MEKKIAYAKKTMIFMYELAKKILHKLQLTEKKMCNQYYGLGLWRRLFFVRTFDWVKTVKVGLHLFGWKSGSWILHVYV
jgi:hypothetical protein